MHSDFAMLDPGLWYFNVFRNTEKDTVESGIVLIPAKKEDLRLWKDSKLWKAAFTFATGYVLETEKRISVVHEKCGALNKLSFIPNIDAPKNKIICTCGKDWEFHQLQGMPEKSFSDTFLYQYVVKGESWPNVIQTRSNGVSSYKTLVSAGGASAVRFFGRYLEEFRKNGFTHKAQ